MREKIELCDESKKKAREDVATQEGDTVAAVCIVKDLDRKELLTCSEKRYRDQMKIFSIWANLRTLDDKRKRVRGSV